MSGQNVNAMSNVNATILERVTEKFESFNPVDATPKWSKYSQCKFQVDGIGPLFLRRLNDFQQSNIDVSVWIKRSGKGLCVLFSPSCN